MTLIELYYILSPRPCLFKRMVKVNKWVSFMFSETTCIRGSLRSVRASYERRTNDYFKQ